MTRLYSIRCFILSTVLLSIHPECTAVPVGAWPLTAGVVDSSSAAFPTLKEGDLLFQDLDCGPLCDAIERVTEGADGMDFSHVGIVAKVHGRIMVVEAIGDDVRATLLEEFIQRSAKVAVGRPHRSYRRIAKRAAHEAVGLIGTLYDEAFLPNNDRLYCSELVALSFEHANNDIPFFETPLMTFKDPHTNALFPAWVEYYERLGVPIPEGVPGCNPGGLSRSPDIEIIWRSDRW